MCCAYIWFAVHSSFQVPLRSAKSLSLFNMGVSIRRRDNTAQSVQNLNQPFSNITRGSLLHMPVPLDSKPTAELTEIRVHDFVRRCSDYEVPSLQSWEVLHPQQQQQKQQLQGAFPTLGSFSSEVKPSAYQISSPRRSTSGESRPAQQSEPTNSWLQLEPLAFLYQEQTQPIVPAPQPLLQPLLANPLEIPTYLQVMSNHTKEQAIHRKSPKRAAHSLHGKSP